MARKNENSVAALRDMPNSMPPMIVAPERDVPGTRASACAQADLERVGPAHRVHVVDSHGLRARPLPALRPQDHEGACNERASHGHRRETARP